MIIIFILTDDDLKKLKKKDPEAFKKLYNENKREIYNFLIIKTKGNKYLSDDILSDTFYSAFISLPKLKNTKNLTGWLIKIAQRRFVDYLKKEYKEKKRMSSVDKNDTFETDIEEKIDQDQKVFILNLALKNINPLYKDVLKMMYMEDLSRKEIAKKINKSLSSIESILFRARRALKKEIIKLTKGL